VPFRDPTSLLITPDHYVNRMLHAHGVPLEDLGVGRGPLDEADSRRAFRLLCEHWSAYRGTPVRYWLLDELAGVFGLPERPSAATADSIYDTIAEKIAQPEFRPRALFERFGIEVLATTDDPCDDLAPHDALAADETFAGRVVPTFRPDRYLDPHESTWNERVDRLGETAGTDVGSYAGYVAALEARRRDLGRRGHRLREGHDQRDGADVVRGRPRDDAAPGRAPQPPPRDLRAVRARRRVRHPGRGRVHTGAGAAAQRLRHAPEPAP